MRGDLEAEQNCNILTPTLIAITAFISRSPGLLKRGPGGPASLGHDPHSSIFSPTHWISCALSYIIIWRPLFFSRASQFRTQFNPSWYSSTGCPCYLHRCISYFDSLAGVNMLHLSSFGTYRGSYFWMDASHEDHYHSIHIEDLDNFIRIS